MISVPTKIELSLKVMQVVRIVIKHTLYSNLGQRNTKWDSHTSFY